MPVAASVLRDHLDYASWATDRMLDAASKLNEEELNRDFGTADRSVLGTLLHVYSGDRIWLARMESAPVPPFPAKLSWTELQTEWPLLHQGWKAWGAALSDAIIAADLEYADLKGRRWKQPTWQIVLHVVNHGTHHRGQALGFVRAMGHAPPPLDLIYFYREHMAASA
jgi:uncharacterized damage-inducible protein DinB